jgi:hypothetical protein
MRLERELQSRGLLSVGVRFFFFVLHLDGDVYYTVVFLTILHTLGY